MAKENHRKTLAKARTRTRTRAIVVASLVTANPIVDIAMRLAALVERRVTRVKFADPVRGRTPMLALWR